MCLFCGLFVFFLSWYDDHRDLHVLTHSFPTRRSSDLFVAVLPGVRPDALPTLAERFRRVIETQPVMSSGGRVPVRVATGWAASPRDGISGSFQIGRAHV